MIIEKCEQLGMPLRKYGIINKVVTWLNGGIGRHDGLLNEGLF